MSPSRRATPAAGTSVSERNHASDSSPHAATRSLGSTWYGNQSPPATAETVSAAGASRTQRTRWPAPARASEEVSPTTPPPTTVTPGSSVMEASSRTRSPTVA